MQFIVEPFWMERMEPNQTGTAVLGWSDTIFCDFRKQPPMLMIRHIFMSPIPKNRWIWRQARAANARQSFHFKKITGTPRMNIFFKSLQLPSFYFKEQSPKIKLEIITKYSIYFFLISKNWQGKTVFDLNNSKQSFEPLIIFGF